MFKWDLPNVLLLALLATVLIACSARINDARLQPSSMPVTFDASNYHDFQDYINQTRSQLKDNSLFTYNISTGSELDAATPYEISPNVSCKYELKSRRGILLIHGLGDVPFIMRDIGEALAQRCFLVRSLLLPGHGTRPGDLLDVTHQDWVSAVEFGVESLKIDVDEVFVGGFSLGGLLAVNHAAIDKNIRGVLAFSPALHLPWLASQLSWFKHIIQWGDVDPHEDYARYSTTPVNAVAQVYPITTTLKASLRTQPLTTPIFIAQSANDPVVDWEKNQELFSQYFINPLNRLVTYQRGGSGVDSRDERILYFNSYLPKAHVYSYSHLAVHISPNNPHYGEQGDYRFCDDDLDNEAMLDCHSAERPWSGEIYQRGNSFEAEKVVARLTYNPQFDRLLSLIDEFLAIKDR